MKVGFIVECTAMGPDRYVYPHVAKMICPELEIEPPKTLINKKKLMAESPTVASVLINSENCDYVFIIWDRIPKWEDSGKCKDAEDYLTKELSEAGIDLSKIILCCISDEMESWIIVDGRYVTEYFQSFTNRDVGKFGDHHSPSLWSKPKDRIKKFNNRYLDFKDDLNIVKLMGADFSQAARWNPSFKHFKEAVERICQLLHAN